MAPLIRFLGNRDFLLSLSIVLGLVAGDGARWTKTVIIPALAVVMTLSIMGIPSSVFRSLRGLVGPSAIGLIMNYGLLSGFILLLMSLLIQDPSLKTGFIIVLAVPPAVAVIPFTMVLKGDNAFSLIATIGCYLGALILMPLITIGLLGSAFVDRGKVVMILIELIIAPLLVSRLLRWRGFSEKIEPYKGAFTNWGFFLVTYTMVGLNRSLFLNHPLLIVPVSLVALASTFLLGFGIKKTAQFWLAAPPKQVSLILLGTHKNTGLAAGLALTLFDERTALPATVYTIAMMIYFIWLNLGSSIPGRMKK